MIDVSLDRSEYQTLPPLTAEQVAAFGLAVVVAKPAELDQPLLSKKHRKLADETRVLTAAIGRGDPSSELTMPFNLREDAAVGNLRRGFEFAASLPASFPRQALGKRCLDKLFANGTGFLKKDGRTQWVKVDEITSKLSDPAEREEATKALGGAEALIELSEAHSEHGRVLGITAPLPETAVPARIAPAVRATRAALTDYAFQVLATVDDDDKATVTRAQKALLPFAMLRADLAAQPKPRDADADTDTDAGTTPVPPAPTPAGPNPA